LKQVEKDAPPWERRGLGTRVTGSRSTESKTSKPQFEKEKPKICAKRKGVKQEQKTQHKKLGKPVM
jgi:hypothetical protein